MPGPGARALVHAWQQLLGSLVGSKVANRKVPGTRGARGRTRGSPKRRGRRPRRAQLALKPLYLSGPVLASSSLLRLCFCLRLSSLSLSASLNSTRAVRITAHSLLRTKLAAFLRISSVTGIFAFSISLPVSACTSQRCDFCFCSSYRNVSSEAESPRVR